jgi:Mn2+/Fe2+ NRAMP family transporter
MFGWRKGIDAKFQQAPFFYGTVLATLAIGVAIALAGVAPIRLLFIASIAGGLATPVTLFFVLLAARKRSLMGAFRIDGWLMLSGWAVFAVTTAAALFYFYQIFRG